jgi:hypothetical protein
MPETCTNQGAKWRAVRTHRKERDRGYLREPPVESKSGFVNAAASGGNCFRTASTGVKIGKIERRRKGAEE